MTSKQVFVTEVPEGIISSKPQNLPGEKKKKNLKKLIEFSKTENVQGAETKGIRGVLHFCLLFQNVLLTWVSNSGFNQIRLLFTPLSTSFSGSLSQSLCK